MNLFTTKGLGNTLQELLKGSILNENVVSGRNMLQAETITGDRFTQLPFKGEDDN